MIMLEKNGKSRNECEGAQSAKAKCPPVDKDSFYFWWRKSETAKAGGGRRVTEKI